MPDRAKVACAPTALLELSAASKDKIAIMHPDESSQKDTDHLLPP
jgi:hypothetical protein